MAHSGRPVPPSANISYSILHNPTFIQHNQNIDQRLYIRSGERSGYARLLENVATAALHDSVHVMDPPKCHPNTRVAIIQNIHNWTVGKAEEQSGKPILPGFWELGPTKIEARAAGPKVGSARLGLGSGRGLADGAANLVQTIPEQTTNFNEIKIIYGSKHYYEHTLDDARKCTYISGSACSISAQPHSKSGNTKPRPELWARAWQNTSPSREPTKAHCSARLGLGFLRSARLGFGLSGRARTSLLKGAAGAGKSAIARSVAERCSDEGLLLGTFFFGAADSTRNHVGKLVATLSYQISVVLPKFRDTVATFIEDDPLIFGRSIRTQFSTLVVRPLSIVLANRPAALISMPRLIIIDGLDECSSIDSQQNLLLTLHEVTSTTTLIRFLVCSRPESHLNNTFSLPRIVPILYKIFLDNDYIASDDIRVYLNDKFKQVKEGHVFKHTLPDPWPTPETIDTLVNKSSGQFIYAATVVRYVKSPRHRPDQRLDAIFKLRPPFKDLPFTELDALYRLIISKAEDLPTVLDILAFPALYPYSTTLEDIEVILQLEQGSVEVVLADLHSIVTTSDGYVEFLHKSLADFLSEPQRAGDLYRDLSRMRLSHAAHVISIYSTHCGQQMGYVSCSWGPMMNLLSQVQDPDNMKADYVSSDILQASQRFPVFEFFRPLLLYDRKEALDQIPSSTESSYEDRDFIMCYLDYLYYVKDVCKSTRLVYWEHMRQYCKCVLAVLDDNLSGKWKAYFAFVYYHLLHDPHYRLPRKLSYLGLSYSVSCMDVGVFGDTIARVVGLLGNGDSLGPYSDDITKISHDLIGDSKKEAIFAMSASFCLAVLCDERSASQEVDRLYGISRHDRRKKREHPWHWRQMVPRPPSLRNRLVLIGFRDHEYSDYTVRLTSIQKALRNSMPYHYENIRVIPMREYFEIKSEPVQKTWPKEMQDERPQQWLQYLFLLDLLPHILPLAGRYEPLVDMCRKKCLSSLSQFWLKKSRHARQAIDSYLCRVDAPEGGE
ncbi:hypothetical protein D9613_012829 [Agrocybe pediades]|uniref:Nephrocystin 3-like N-terminal domain-containing protein n=1 Tax=Agrocybe pediades TaxID=84607 RepID=A0A8H4R1I8_9AGAR|nr:hypothetical protein D9613_012829 [Agrocybe pediades]